VSLTKLVLAPFNLVVNESIYAKVVAYNLFGESVYSEPGNGASMQTVPDAPLSLINDDQITDASIIRFTWSEGVQNGASPVIDYQVYYD